MPNITVVVRSRRPIVRAGFGQRPSHQVSLGTERSCLLRQRIPRARPWDRPRPPGSPRGRSARSQAVARGAGEAPARRPLRRARAATRRCGRMRRRSAPRTRPGPRGKRTRGFEPASFKETPRDAVLQHHGEQGRADGAADPLDNIDHGGGARHRLARQRLVGRRHRGHHRAARAESHHPEGHHHQDVAIVPYTRAPPVRPFARPLGSRLRRYTVDG
jgi:hypothetical protein